MEVSSTPNYPRYPPYRLPPSEPVSVVGEVLQLDESNRKLTLRVDPQSNLKIEVAIPETQQCAQLRGIKFLEVRGYVESGNEMTLKEYCNFGDNFDLATYSQVIKLSTDSQFRKVFGLRM